MGEVQTEKFCRGDDDFYQIRRLRGNYCMKLLIIFSAGAAGDMSE